MITETEQKRRKAISIGKTKHSHAGGTTKRTREYHIWASMIQRCTNPKNKDYARYGGAGVKVCRDWESFPHFLAYAGLKPDEASTLERIDNSLGYQPGNVKWASRKEQARNRSSTIWVKLGDDYHTLSEACEQFGISYGMVRGRLRLGWTLEDALDTPKGNTRARV